MGTWQTIGSITPQPTSWQLLPLLTGAELFRLEHQWELNHWWKPRGLIAQSWDNLDFLVRPFKIFPRSDQRDLVTLPIPEPYKIAGLQTRAIAVLLLTPYTADSTAYSWELSIEAYELDPDEIPPPNTGGIPPSWDDTYAGGKDSWDGVY